MDAIAPLSAPHSAPRTTAAAKASRAFETLVLTNFVETMLPKNEALYGGGTGADLWRSQLAQAIGAQWARADTFGFTDQLGLET